MSKYLVWCFDDNNRTQHKASSEKEAQGFYENAIKSGCYSSVVMRREERTHGHAIKTWSEKEGEAILC